MTAAKPAQGVPGKLNPATIGLFLDVDGTLLDIAPRPEAVEGKPGLLDDLAAVDRALVGQQSVSVKTLGTLIGLSEPLAIVSALICQRVLDTDLSTTFGLNSLVARRWDLGATLILKEAFGGPAFRREKAMNENTWPRGLKGWTRVAAGRSG